MKLYKMIEVYLKYDSMHTFRIINAFIYINNHVNSCTNSMLSCARGAREAGCTRGLAGRAHAGRGWLRAHGAQWRGVHTGHSDRARVGRGNMACAQSTNGARRQELEAAVARAGGCDSMGGRPLRTRNGCSSGAGWRPRRCRRDVAPAQAGGHSTASSNAASQAAAMAALGSGMDGDGDGTRQQYGWRRRWR